MMIIIIAAPLTTIVSTTLLIAKCLGGNYKPGNAVSGFQVLSNFLSSFSFPRDTNSSGQYNLTTVYEKWYPSLREKERECFGKTF